MNVLRRLKKMMKVRLAEGKGGREEETQRTGSGTRFFGTRVDLYITAAAARPNKVYY